MKDQLIFDTTNANTILDSDSVGAFIRSDDGTLITHHTVGSDEGLDVYIVNTSIAVTATDLDIRDLDSSQDSVEIKTAGGQALAIDGSGYITANINGDVNVTQGTSPWVVSATDLDIRDLTAASDSVESWTHDGTGTAITSTVVGADTGLDVNVIGGVNVEVDLSHVDDSVALGDGTNLLTSTTIGSDIGLDVNVINDPALANTAIATAANTLDVADTAEDVVASPLSNRKYLFVYNDGNRKIYVGASGVTAAAGFPISPGSYLELRAGASIDIEYVGQSGASGSSAALRSLELS
jgi:hypothetical protein